MSKTIVAEPSFRAVGIVTQNGVELVSDPFVFDIASGVNLIAQRKRWEEGFEIISAHNRRPGFGRFEKTCGEPVTFLVYRDEQPYFQVEVKNLFKAMRLALRAGVGGEANEVD